MRTSLALAAAGAALFSTSAALAMQKIGARTLPPEQVLALAGEGSTDAELQRLAAAASAFRLGSVQNPIRVGGPNGRRAYLDRLRCPGGSRPGVTAGPAGAIGGFGSVVERFQLSCGSPAPEATEIAIDIYHQGHVETRAPAGFALDAR